MIYFSIIISIIIVKLGVRIISGETEIKCTQEYCMVIKLFGN